MAHDEIVAVMSKQKRQSLQKPPFGVKVSPGGVKDDRSSDVHDNKDALGEA